MTSKEAARALKEDIDNAMQEIFHKHLQNYREYMTVQTVFRTEWTYGLFEIMQFGRILDNRERWHGLAQEFTVHIYETYIKGKGGDNNEST